ncbi:UbiA family prenyltransferase [Aspergillus ibericus CBS 121593]|uniref:UbiA prenyltransferase n=1 Tax=Aspergillus ibericus CBS 121593 TaxID=1448316 RepID=A0A395GKI1_9EURO|nr:hypothetical protein BO80DRAFT_468989 [Aspergillus ibericus CBS 121593]RAK96001.1 hypothetical protein BO80DRAFT_468989 [Aspergillus ibericus CBS 121593]
MQVKNIDTIGADTLSPNSARLPNNPPWPNIGIIKTIYLFTSDDITTFIIPETLFGLSAALSGPLLTDNPTPELLPILSRIPVVILWNWLNLLIFNLSNQRFPSSVSEDKINRPWRPLPAGLITSTQTRHLLLLMIPIVLGVSIYLSAWEETALLYTLNWTYNDLGGGDDGFVLRNVLLAIAFSQYNKGSLRVATCGKFDIPPRTCWWILITSALIGTTMHIQDIKDMEGDRAKNRRTVPIVWGDGPARWSVAVPVVVWSVVCPAFWGLGVLGYVLPVGVGVAIACRTLLLRGVAADRMTWKMWTAWTGVIWMLPLFKDHGVFVRSWGSLG